MLFFGFVETLDLDDNTGLIEAALAQDESCDTLFLYSTSSIINELPEDDPRIGFIHESLKILDDKLKNRAAEFW